MITKDDLKNYERLFRGFDKHHTRKAAKVFLLRKFMKGESIIDFIDVLPDPTNSFYKQNTKILQGTKLHPDYCLLLQKEFNEIKKELKVHLKVVEEDDNDQPLPNVDCKNGICEIDKDIYLLQPHHTIYHINDALDKSRGNCKFKFDFSKLPLTTPDVNSKLIQRFKIVIQSPINDMVSYARLHYRCDKCGYEFGVNLNKVASSKMTVKCENLVSSGDRVKECGHTLKEPTQESDFYTLHRYDASYNVDGKPISTVVESFPLLENYEYEMAGLVLNNNYDSYILCLDMTPIKKHVLDYNNFLVERENEEKEKDIIPDIIKFMDKKIEEFSGHKVLGMYDVKFQFLIQKLTECLGWSKIWNIALVGEKDVGKTYITNHYCGFLYGGRYKATFGKSTSIPSLRGSSSGNREIGKGNKNRMGLLGTFSAIYIDEIYEEKDLMDSLKPCLLNDIYSNDKADGDKTDKKKEAQLTISENPDRKHIAEYHEEVKVLYNEYLDSGVIKKEDRVEYDMTWDLHLPLYEYNDNPLLKKTLREIRKRYYNKQTHWIDGRQLAVHDRFPVYLYLRGSKSADGFDDRIMAAMENELKGKDDVGLKAKLSCENINEWFIKYNKYENITIKREVLDKLKDVIVEYDIALHPRLATCCMRILNASRILNCRMYFNDTDFNHVRRFLWLQERGIYKEELDDGFVIHKHEIVMDNIKDMSDSFGISMDEFK